MTGEEHFWKRWVLCTVRIHVPCSSKQKQDKGYTEKYLQDSFFTMPFVHTTRLGNRTYQICCNMNHFQQNNQNVLLFTFYKNRKWLSEQLFSGLDELTRRSGTVLDGSHQDISGTKLRKLGKSRNEMKVYYTWRMRNLISYQM